MILLNKRNGFKITGFILFKEKACLNQLDIPAKLTSFINVSQELTILVIILPKKLRANNTLPNT